MNPRISIDPTILHRTPVIKGTWIPVSQILEELSTGRTTDDIISDFPNLSQADIVAALQFGSELASFETIETGTN